ncbi:MAG: hypothetical protein J6Z31_06425 [Fibrobacter sp.]|nr:hypothetical protein [Fibrobacter sp.]
MGHIFFISDDRATDLTELANWTLDWMLSHDIPADTAIYTCKGIEQGEKALDTPLSQGESPALIVLDHGVKPTQESIAFGNRLRDLIPESWIVELVEKDYPISKQSDDAFFLPKPIRKSDWEDVLQHVFVEAGSPQWSNVTPFRP